MNEIPTVDTLAGARTLLVDTGWLGHGFALSLADWADGGEQPTLLLPFSYGRSLPLPRAKALRS